MEFSEHRCRNCGGQLNQIEKLKWRCPYCNSTFEDSTITKDTECMSKLFDEANQETIRNLRRNLYDATHAEYISSVDVHSACKAIKQYLPDDFQANFYEIAAGNNVKQITKAIRKIDVDKNIDDMEGIIQFLIGSLESEYQLDVNNLIARAFETRDPVKYEHYCTLLSDEAVKVDMGVYETKIPRDVFIAYSSKDMEQVSELVEVLEAQKFKCFVAARNLRHGKGSVENYNKALEEAMDHCKSFVFISTVNSRSLNCDALKVELAYVKHKDIEIAPAEYKNNYETIPARYKKPRVEYRIGETADHTAADEIVKDFFNGYERVYTPDQVAKRVMMQIIESPHATESMQVKYVDMEQKKICVSCGAENNINTKFCGDCGKNEFVNSVSELIKLRKIREDEEKAKNEAALAEAAKAAQEALAAAEKAKKDAEAKAKAAEEAKKAEALKNAGASSSYSGSSYSYKPKKKISVGLIVFLVLLGISIPLGIISMVMNSDNKEPDTSAETEVVVNGDNNNNDGQNNENTNGSNKSDYPNLSFTEVGGGWSVSANADRIDNLTGELVIPSVIEGKNVVEIPESGFANCAGLTSVTVPDTVKTIGAAAFSGCSSLREITVPFVGKSSTSTSPIERLFGYIFGDDNFSGGIAVNQYCNYGISGDRLYYVPAQLTKVTVTSATGLGYGAFSRCANLTEINLNENVYTIDPCVFMDCSSLKSVSLPNVTSISDSAFQNCTSLESFTIGDKVANIGSLAFDNCTSLARLNSETDGLFVVEENVKSIGAGAFRGCTLIKEMIIPFVGTSQTTTSPFEKIFGVIFGDSEYLGSIATNQYCNYGISGYRLYYIPAQLTKVTVTSATGLGYGAFNACSMLQSITINTAAQSNIGEKAFENCPATIVYEDYVPEEETETDAEISQ